MATYKKTFSKNSAYTLYLDVTETGYDISTNESVVSWTLRAHSDKALQYGSWEFNSSNTQYRVSINGSQVASGYKTYDFREYKNLTIASGTATIEHDDDGTKTVACSASYCNSSASIGSASVSGNFGLTPIPRLSDITVSDPVEMGVPTSVSVTQKSADFSHYLYSSIDDGTTWVEIGHGTTSDDYMWTPTDTASSLPNDSSTTYKLKCETYLTSDYTGTTLDTIIDVTVNVPSSYTPTISIGTITEGNSNVPNDFPFIVGYSKLTVPTTASGNHNSTVVSRSIAVGNETKTSTATGTVSLTMDKTLTATVNAVTANVVDSRERTGTASTSVLAVAYTLPSINELDVTRCASNGTPDPLGTYVAVRTAWDWTSVLVSGVEKNSAYIEVYVDDEQSPRSTYTTLTNSQQTLTQIALLSGIQTADQYTITVKIVDELDYTVRQQLVSKSVMPLSLYDDGSDIGVTIGRMATQGGFNNWLDTTLVSGKDVNLWKNDQIDDTFTTDELFARVGNVPSLNGVLLGLNTTSDSVGIGTLAWTNPDGDTTGFSTKTVTLTGFSASDYSYYEVLFNGLYTDIVYCSTGKIPVGQPSSLFYLAVSSSNYRIRARDVTASTDAGGNIQLTFAQGYQWTGGSTTGSSNNICIPVHILLYK